MTSRTSHRTLVVLLLLLAVSALGACSGAALLAGGAATAGIAVAQERSVGAAVDDTTIQIQIKHHLFQERRDLVTRISSEVHEGRVLLTGVVPIPEDRVEAVRLAWQADGVVEVLNEIQVADRGGVTEYLKDVRITTQLTYKMLRDPDVADINFSIETVKGVVYLMGVARTGAELKKVTTYASHIAGVQKVVSHVRLSDDPRRGKS